MDMSRYKCQRVDSVYLASQSWKNILNFFSVVFLFICLFVYDFTVYSLLPMIFL